MDNANQNAEFKKIYEQLAIRQNVMIGVGVAGFVYLASKIGKLEAFSKKE